MRVRLNAYPAVILVHGHRGPPIDRHGKPLDRYSMAPDDPDREKLKGIITDNVRLGVPCANLI